MFTVITPKIIIDLYFHWYELVILCLGDLIKKLYYSVNTDQKNKNK